LAPHRARADVGADQSLPQVALVAGLVYGAVGQTEELVRRMRGVIGERARVIAAGGMAGVVAAETSVIECVEPHLMLHGLRCDHIAGAGTG
jgi:pantothenate kinase type III